MAGGKVIIITGARGTGKSTFMKSMLAKVHKDARIIYDVNNEYGDLYDKPLLEFEEFTEVITKVSNAVIGIEESTIFLSNRGNDRDIINLLVKARHRGNTIFFAYHSLRSIPKYIYDLANYVVIFKTNDNPKKIQEKFQDDDLTAAFIKVSAMPWLENKGVKYSPYLMYDIYG